MLIDSSNNIPEKPSDKLQTILDKIPQEEVQTFIVTCGSIIGLFTYTGPKQLNTGLLTLEFNYLKQILCIDDIIILLAYLGLVLNGNNVQQIIPDNLMFVRMQEIVEGTMVKLRIANPLADEIRNGTKANVDLTLPQEETSGKKLFIEGTVKFKFGGLCVEGENGKIWSGEIADEKLNKIPLGAWVKVYKDQKEIIVQQLVS